jgi:hypothetical protein
MPQAVKRRQRRALLMRPSADLGGSSKYSYETYEDQVRVEKGSM